MSARCDMRADCAAPVVMIGSKGYVYCREHGVQRRGVERTRLMRPWELKLILAGKPLPSYEPLPRAVALAGGVNAYLNRNLPGSRIDPEPAAPATGDDDDDDETCSECGEPTDDGEGYDGLCGNCADRAEQEGRWS